MTQCNLVGSQLPDFEQNRMQKNMTKKKKSGGNLKVEQWRMFSNTQGSVSTITSLKGQAVLVLQAAEQATGFVKMDGACARLTS